MSEKGANNSRNQHRAFWGKVCQEVMHLLIAHALRLTNGRRWEAEDLAQGTVCRILQYPKDPNEIKSPLGFLLTIMRRLWITKWHKEKTASTESLDELLSTEAEQRSRPSVEPAVEPEVLQILENNELRAKLSANQGPLTPREKLLLKLYLEGYTCAEIADKLHEDVRLVRSDLNATRTKVRSRLRKRKR
jgi:RNA polymerase sigma factor (sigma-70 family)